MESQKLNERDVEKGRQRGGGGFREAKVNKFRNQLGKIFLLAVLVRTNIFISIVLEWEDYIYRVKETYAF